VLRETFTFEAPEHPFHDRIIITIALPTHTTDHFSVPELLLVGATGILTAPI
jgi:hypothetical protein